MITSILSAIWTQMDNGCITNTIYLPHKCNIYLELNLYVKLMIIIKVWFFTGNGNFKAVSTYCIIYSPNTHWLVGLPVNTSVVSFWLFTTSLHFAMATTFPPGLTGVFGTSLACYYCLSLLSITQITTMLIHMHGPIITCSCSLAAGSCSAHASLCSLL